MQTLPPLPVPEAGASGTAADLLALRRRTIAGLAEAIYGRGLPPSTIKQVEHDPVLRQRAAAVEMLGQFPDPEAVAVLADLVLRGEREIPAPAGRWLRDTALLTLLRSTRLPAAEVDRALGRVYSYARHPFPWQWNAVYDDLPLLQRYGKIGVFFRAFWLWPLLVLGGLPTLGAIGQIVANTSVGAVGGGFDWSVLRDLLIVLGTGLEIYLVHQVIIALLAGLYGPPLRLPNRTPPRWKAVVGAGLAVIVLIMLLVMLVMVVTSAFTIQVEGVSTGQIALRLAVLVFPLLLLPMFMLAHDLEQAVRYAVQRQGRGLRLWAAILRRTTDVIYIVVLPFLAGAIWLDRGAFGPSVVAFLAYLCVVPFIVTGGLWVLTRLGTLLGGNTAPPLAKPADR